MFFYRIFIMINITLLSFIIYAEPVLIITHNYNRPDFVEIQYKTFKKFLIDDYEFVVFNDAREQAMEQAINDMCAYYNVRCIRIPQEIHTRPYLPRFGEPLHSANVRHSNAIQYSLDILGFDHNGIVTIIDSDMFLIRPFSIINYMEKTDIAAVIKGAQKTDDIRYLWPALTFLHMDRLPDKRTLNFNCGNVLSLCNWVRLDAGGASYYYLKRFAKQLRVQCIDEILGYQLFCPDIVPTLNTHLKPKEQKLHLQKRGFNTNEIEFLQQKPDSVQFLCNNHFFHYREGSNYRGFSNEYHANKYTLVNQFITKILQETTENLIRTTHNKIIMYNFFNKLSRNSRQTRRV